MLNRNPYVGRSFIQPSNQLRLAAVVKKFGVIQCNVTDKRIILVDDSIVRGNTMGIIVSLLKSHGAKEVSFATILLLFFYILFPLMVFMLFTFFWLIQFNRL